MPLFRSIPSLIFGTLILAGLPAGTLAQATWQTTKTSVNGFDQGSCNLERAQMRVKVHPAWLDVEEELEISALGAVQTGNDANTLEITGTFSLPPGSIIVGSLLWDGDRLLEGKLLDRAAADSLYEDMVERNSLPPPRPRDPLILELAGKDTYRLRIYPVRLGNSRRLRLRYQLPPRITGEGLEMVLKSAAGSLFPGSSFQVPVTFEGGGPIRRAILAEVSGRTTLEFPRTRFLALHHTGPAGWQWYPGGLYQLSQEIRILPVDPLRQVMVKTRFESGAFAGNYLNLYAGVTDAVMGGLGQRVEVVVLWRWHNAGHWIRATRYGEEITPYLWEAQYQAGQLRFLHSSMGAPGYKVGLVHDDSRSEPKAFRLASRGEAEYDRAAGYLQDLEQGGVEKFVRSVRIDPAARANLPADIAASKERFRADIRLVRSLFSEDGKVVRHILLVSAGGDNLADTRDMNAALASAMDGLPFSVSGLGGATFNQAGFDFWQAGRDHPIRGQGVATPWGTLPGLPDMNLSVTVRNARKAYDFNIPCQGGLGLACGTLSFHGKSDAAWSDSLDWEAFDASGKPLGKTRSGPDLIGEDGDTAIASLWAGSESPFSEKKELPLGPTYGFVDRWASLLALEKDSLDRARAEALADSGVPRIANADLKDVIPNYQDGQTPGGVSLARVAGPLGDPSSWRLERLRGGLLLLRVPGLAAGRKVELEAYDLHGRRLAAWTALSEEGLLRWNPAGVARGSVCILKARIGAHQGIRRVTL